MRFRSLDADGVNAYWNELRLRLLAVRIDAGRVRLRWWVPAWAIEEPLRFLLRLVPIATALAPGATRRLLERTGIGTRIDLPAADRSDAVWRALDDLFSEADRDLLAMPGDVPFVDVTTNDVRVYVGQARL